MSMDTRNLNNEQSSALRHVIQQNDLGHTKILFVAVQLALVLYSLYHFEPPHNLFIRQGAKKHATKKPLLHLTNYGYLLTILVAAARILGIWSSVWWAVYLQLLPIAFTIEIIITVVFWILFMKNKSLIIDGTRAPRPWYGHLLRESPKHLIPFLVLLSEVVVLGFPRMGATGAGILMGFILVYSLASEIYTYVTGDYVYAILEKFRMPLRPVLFVGIMWISILTYSWLRWMLGGDFNV